MQRLKKTAAFLSVAVILATGTGLLAVKPASNVDAALTALPPELHTTASPSAVEPSGAPSVSGEQPTGAPSAAGSPSGVPDSTLPGAGASPAPSGAPAGSPDIPYPSPGDEVSYVTPGDEVSAVSTPSGTPASGSSSGSVPVNGSSSGGQATPSESPGDTKPGGITPSDRKVTLIGDSIGIDVMPYLKEYYPGLNVEAKEGRQFYEAKTLIRQMIDSGTLAPTVVLELGSNGTVKESALRDVIELMGKDRKIVLVNTQVPRSWCTGVNEVLVKISAEYPNTIVADWFSASNGKDEYFYNDGFHPNATGSPVLARLIADAITALYEKPVDADIVTPE